MATFEKCGENLVRHQGGVIYLRAKVAGKPIRQSLGVTDLRIAKLKRDAALEKLRQAASTGAGTIDAAQAQTMAQALNAFEASIMEQPHLRDRSRDYYREIFTILRATIPGKAAARSWTAAEASAWWKTVAGKYAPQRANNTLGMLKRVTRHLADTGVRPDDPAKKLKRVRVVPKKLNIPSRETMDALISSIRTQGKAHSSAAAAFVGFLAFSGCRYSQAVAADWEHVTADWIEFPGHATGAKGASVRKLPLTGPLRAVLEDIARIVDPDGEPGTLPTCGPILSLVTAKEALRNACKRLKVPALRLHDLRHFFASHALERGVDVPTVAKWLGHKDGGVLVLRTYGHVRDEHSRREAEKMG